MTATQGKSDMNPELFKAGMRKLLSGISLVTTESGGKPYGFIATSVSSLSTDPPSLILCVSKSASAHDALLESRVLCVNILSSEQSDLVGKFSSSARRDERFRDDRWSRGEAGAPVFDDSLVSLECEIGDVIPKYSHSIIIADVRRIRVNQESRMKPMAYFDGKCA